MSKVEKLAAPWKKVGQFLTQIVFCACMHASSTSSRFKLVQLFNHSFSFFGKNRTTELIELVHFDEHERLNYITSMNQKSYRYLHCALSHLHNSIYRPLYYCVHCVLLWQERLDNTLYSVALTRSVNFLITLIIFMAILGSWDYFKIFYRHTRPKNSITQNFVKFFGNTDSALLP